ncbi:hypothetical protein QBC40DRAFT_86225 [Triangularia verruculosa]|uniref:Uncharacterized protein n=1 Tax=Triangularia verruculosa TaxID=2587418 RepID=A0AAN7AVK9_9PEZI|nr:hypothetical protein QBC40DRAFT_86225 [Triangularia verruculosa]
MSYHDSQSTASESWSVISKRDVNDFVDETHTRSRMPQFKQVNIPSGRIGCGSTTAFEEDPDAAAARTQQAISNEDSTVTAGTDDTQIRIDDDAAGQPSGGVNPIPSTSKPRPTETPGTLRLTLENMVRHQRGTHFQDVDVWVGGAGSPRLVRHQAPLKGSSSSVASSRSAVSNGSWTRVIEPTPMDEQLAFTGIWSNNDLDSYGAPKPAGN